MKDIQTPEKTEGNSENKHEKQPRVKKEIKQQQKKPKNQRPLYPESFQRIGHLYNISKFMQNKGKHEISRIFIKHINQIAEKNVVRLGSSIKSKFCKKCSTFIKWNYEEIKEKSKLCYIEGTCLICKGTFKNILTNSQNLDRLKP